MAITRKNCISVRRTPFSAEYLQKVQHRLGLQAGQYSVRPDKVGKATVWFQPVQAGPRQNSFTPCGTPEQVTFRTREPDIDGMVYAAGIQARMNDPGHALHAEAVKANALLQRMTAYDQLPQSLAHALLAIHVNSLDAKRKSSESDTHEDAIDAWMRENFKRDDADAEQSTAKSLYAFAPIAYAYAGHLLTVHGETVQTAPQLRYFETMPLKTLITTTPDLDLKRALLSDQLAEKRVALTDKKQAAHKKGEPITWEERFEISDQMTQLRGAWIEQLSLPADFFMWENIADGDVQTLGTISEQFLAKLKTTRTEQLVEILQRKIGTLSLQTSADGKKTPMTAVNTENVARQARFHLRMLDKILEAAQATPLAREKGGEQAFIFERVQELIYMLPSERMKTIRTTDELVDAIFELVVTLPDLPWLGREWQERAIRWGAPEGFYHEWIHRKDGENLLKQIEKARGFSDIKQRVIAALSKRAEFQGLADHEVEEMVEHYFGCSWIAVIERDSGIRWPHQPNFVHKADYNVEYAATEIVRDRSAGDFIFETVNNLSAAQRLFVQHRPEQWSAVADSFVLPPFKEGASEDEIRAETTAREEFTRQFRQACTDNPRAFGDHFNRLLLTNILYTALAPASTGRGFVFDPQRWNIATFFGHTAFLDKSARGFMDAFLRDFRDLTFSRVAMMKEAGSFEVPDPILDKIHDLVSGSAHEVGFAVYGNGDTIELVPWEYPLIAREDMLYSNNAERPDVTEKQNEKGRYLLFNGHSHTTNDTQISMQDRKAQNGEFELIISPVDGATLYNPDGVAVDSPVVQRYNEKFHEGRAPRRRRFGWV